MSQSAGNDARVFERKRLGFEFEGDKVSLANFTNIVYNHDNENDIGLSLTIDFSNPRQKASFAQRGLHRLQSVTYDYLLGAQNIVEVKISFQYANDDSPLTLTFLDLTETGRFSASCSDGVQLTQLVRDIAATSINGRTSDEDWDRWGQLDSTAGVYTSSHDSSWGEFLDTCVFGLRGISPILTGTPPGHRHSQERALGVLLMRLDFVLRESVEGVHIGPLREISSRLNYSGAALTVDNDSDWAGAKESRLSKSPVDAASNWLLKLTGGRYKFQNIEFLAADAAFLGKMYSDVVIDTLTGTQVTLADVGVGISQVFPILTALTQQSRSKRGSLITIEQPELHLHPAMQAELGDLFIEFSRRSGLQIIAETHSEALLLRLIKRLRDKEIPPDEVAVIYVDSDPVAKSNYASNLEISPANDFMVDMPLSFSSIRLRDSL